MATYYHSVDPVMVTSSGYDLNINVNKSTLKNILSKINLVTPNILELENKNLHWRQAIFKVCLPCKRRAQQRKVFGRYII